MARREHRLARMRRRPLVLDLSRVRVPRARNDLALILVAEAATASRRAREGFESVGNALGELRTDIRALQRYLGELPLTAFAAPRRAATIDLIVRLQNAAAGADEPSFANPVYVREFRRRYLGEVLRKVRKADPGDIRYYTIASGAWRYKQSHTLLQDPFALRESFRAHLNRSGNLADLSGWCIGFYHNEFDSGLREYQPHFHFVVKGEKYLAFEALHTLPQFKGGGTPYRPVQCDALGNAIRQTGYLHKPYVMSQHSAPTGRGGRRRTGKPQRLPTALLAATLLAMDQMSFADMVWMHGVVLDGGRLRRSDNA